MTPEKDARTYRILFYVAVLLGFVAAFLMWCARQPHGGYRPGF